MSEMTTTTTTTARAPVTAGEAAAWGNTAVHGRKTASWELVTSAQAGVWLEQNNTRNRHMGAGWPARMRRDMASGDWIETHQGIAFDWNGVLVDGQNRLEAVRTSGMAQLFLVVRGLDPKAIEAIDRHKVRSLANTLQILGYEHNSASTVAIARAALTGPSPSSPDHRASDADVKRFIDRNPEALIFSNRKKLRAVGAAPLCAVICRAYTHVPLDRLERFISAVLDEIPFEDARAGDRTARRFAKVCESMDSISSGRSRLSIYRKGQNALRVFLDGKDFTHIYECEDDLFPLPGHEPERRKGRAKGEAALAESA